MKALPITLAGIHALACVVIFGAAIGDPERSGLLPLILYFSDYPASLAMELIRGALHGSMDIEGQFAVDGLVYLTFGSAWFYLIGSLLHKLMVRYGLIRS